MSSVDSIESLLEVDQNPEEVTDLEQELETNVPLRRYFRNIAGLAETLGEGVEVERLTEQIADVTRYDRQEVREDLRKLNDQGVIEPVLEDKTPKYKIGEEGARYASSVLGMNKEYLQSLDF